MGDVEKALIKQRNFFRSGGTLSYGFRMKMLDKLAEAIVKYEKEICDALKKDFNKSEFEVYATELGIILEEIRFHKKRLKKWMKPVRISTPLFLFGSRSVLIKEPLGVVLITAPWNYPVNLLFTPLVGAISAGNCSILKPADYTANTRDVITKLISETFDESYITVFTGGRDVNDKLFRSRVDHIFFTGSPELGKRVMQIAAENLIPVTLELGGKSPCIVDESADTKLAAKRIIWGKLLNGGQTCVAPDYVLVSNKVKMDLLSEMKNIISKFYGSEDQIKDKLPHIINDRHFARVTGYLKDANIYCGGITDQTLRYVSPTIIVDPPLTSQVMNEEIFAPILPVIGFDNLSEPIELINSRPHPLALYVFSGSKINIDKIISRCISGGICINDTIVHTSNPHLPFGGVGNSGMGRYHGKASFDTFSHHRGMVITTKIFDLPVRYPPYGNKINIVKKLMK